VIEEQNQVTICLFSYVVGSHTVTSTIIRAVAATIYLAAAILRIEDTKLVSFTEPATYCHAF